MIKLKEFDSRPFVLSGHPNKTLCEMHPATRARYILDMANGACLADFFYRAVYPDEVIGYNDVEELDNYMVRTNGEQWSIEEIPPFFKKNMAESQQKMHEAYEQCNNCPNFGKCKGCSYMILMDVN